MVLYAVFAACNFTFYIYIYIFIRVQCINSIDYEYDGGEGGGLDISEERLRAHTNKKEKRV